MSGDERAANEADATAAVTAQSACSGAPTPTVELIACETCGPKDAVALHGSTDGARLGLWLRRLADTAPEVRVSSTRCLWACSRSCAVHVRGLDGPHSTHGARVGYVIATLEPTEVAARALLDYATLYAATADGAVPFKQWPAPLRGHFLCRIPAVTTPAAPTATAPTSSKLTRDSG